MKPSLIVATTGVVVLIAAVGYYYVVDSGKDGGLTGPPHTVPTCEVDQIPFGVGLLMPGDESFDPIHLAEPHPIDLPAVLTLHDGSDLSASNADLCAAVGKPVEPGSLCDGIDSFTFGNDWLPLMPGADDHFFTLSDFTSGGGPGWCILFFTNGLDVFALGWGQPSGGGGNLLRKTWPEVDPVTGEAINTGLMDMTDAPPTSLRPLHRGDAVLPREGMLVDGLDFHAWVPLIGPKPPWNEYACFESPSGMADVPPRLYYTLRRPAVGEGQPDDGAVVWWTEPEALEDGSFKWTQPARLCADPLPGLPDQADIVALGYYRIPDDTPAGLHDRQWLTEDVLGEDPADPGATVTGLLMYALDPASYEGGGVAHPFEELEPFYVAPVIEDAAGALSYGPSRPLMTHLSGLPLRDVVGPRSRGVCPADPRLLIGGGGRQPR